MDRVEVKEVVDTYQKLGLEPPDRGKAGRKVKVPDDRLRELVEQGLSPMAIGLEVGLGQAQTVRRLKKLGVLK